MTKTKKTTNRTRTHKQLLTGLVLGVLAFTQMNSAYALPTDGSVQNGIIAISKTLDGKTMNIKQDTDKGIINWGTFNVAGGETVNFQQPNSTAMTLNRVVGGELSTIAGNINANGNIILINPNGILFSQGSQVNVAGIVASTANISDEDFLADKLYFAQSNTANNKITVDGTITASTVLKSTDTPASKLSVINNQIKLVADGNIEIGANADLTAVTRTKLSNSVTVGQEGFDVEDTTLAVNGRIILRADQNADNDGKVTMQNAADKMKSWQVDVYYNPETMPDAMMHGVDYRQKNVANAVNHSANIAESITPVYTGVATGGGSVTAVRNSYMLINDVYQLQNIGHAGNLGGKYAQGRSINASPTKDNASWNANNGFDPITTFGGQFSGDGGSNVYSINKLYINRPTTDNQGLFGTLTGSAYCVNPHDFEIVGRDNVGAVAGYLNGGYIERAYTHKSDTNSNAQVKGRANVGGLVGREDGVARIHWSSNAQTVEGTTNVGGVVGDMQGKSSLTWVNNSGIVKGEAGAQSVGGVVGNMVGTDASNPLQVRYSYNRGQISGTTDTGGVVGTLGANAKLQNVYNTNESGTLNTYIDSSKLNTPSTYGTVTGVTNTGGVVGRMTHDSSIIDTAYNAGNVSGTDNTGGLVGNMEKGEIAHAYNADNNTVLDARTGANAGTQSTYGDIPEYYGFSHGTDKYTYDIVSKTWTKTDSSSHVTTGIKVADLNIAAPAAERVYNIRLAHRDATVTGTNSNTGGLVGHMTTGEIKQVYNAGKVSGSTNTGALIGQADGGTMLAADAFFATTDKGSSNIVSGVSNAFGSNSSPANVQGTAKTLYEMQKPGTFNWTDGKATPETVSSAHNQNADWMVFDNQATPLLKSFMKWININRELEYSGKGNNLITHDVPNYYGSAYFTDFNKGINVNDVSTPAITATEYEAIFKKPITALQEKSSKYVYDQAELWSPQHGYYTDPTATLLVLPKALYVNVTGNRTYGERPLVGINELGVTDPTKEYAATVTGFANDETVAVLDNKALAYKGKNGAEFGFGDVTNTNAGSHVFNTAADFGGVTAKNHNYRVVYRGTLNIGKANLNYTAHNKTKVYGAPNPDFTGEFSGFIPGDDLANAAGTKKAVVLSSATYDSNVGQYAINIDTSATNFTNYNVMTLVPGTLTITKAPLTYTADNKTKYYGQDNPTLTGTYSGFRLGQAEATVARSGDMTLGTDAQKQSDVGQYNITATGKENVTFTNYEVTEVVNAKLDINKADLNFTATGEIVRGKDPQWQDLRYKAGVTANDNANNGNLKTWDAAHKENLNGLKDFATNGAKPMLYYVDNNGHLQLIDMNTNPNKDAGGNVMPYTLDGSSFVDNGAMQLLAKNYNFNFVGGGLKVKPIQAGSANPIYQSNRFATIYVDNGADGFREVDSKYGTRFLTVLQTGINLDKAFAGSLNNSLTVIASGNHSGQDENLKHAELSK